MQRYGSISVMTVLVLGAMLASAQQRGGRPQPPPRGFSAPAPQQHQAPPPQGQPQRSDRGDQNAGRSQGEQPQIQQRQGDRRFLPLGPGPHAGSWIREHADEPTEQQLKELERDPNYKQLPRDRQERLRNSLTNFNSLPPQQRQRILQRMEIFEHMTPEQEQKTRDMFRDFRQLPEDRRHELTGAFRQLQEMSPEERQKTIDSEEFRRKYSDKERDLLRGMSDLGFGPKGQKLPQE